MPPAPGHHILDSTFRIEHHQIGVRARGQAAFARQHQQPRRVRGEGRQHPLQRLTAGQQLLQRLGHRRRPADIHGGHPAGGVEHRQTAAPVGAHRHPVRRKSRLEIAAERLGRGPAIIPLLHRECGDVDGAAPLGQRHRVLEQRLPPVHVGGIEHSGGELGSLQSLAHQLQPAGAIAHVQVHDAGLAHHEPGHVRISRDPKQLVQGGLTRAMVADRQLPHSQDEIDQDDVLPYAAGDRRRRHVISAGVAIGAQPLCNQPARRRHQLGGGSHRVVGAEHADGRGDPAGREPAQRQRRNPGVGAGLAATAGEMNVPVDQPRDHPPSVQVPHLDVQRPRERRSVGSHPDDPLARHQQVRAAPWLRVVQLGIAKQFHERRTYFRPAA